MILSWRAPSRHRYTVVYDGIPIASAQTMAAAEAYMKLAFSHDALVALCLLEQRPSLKIYETFERATA